MNKLFSDEEIITERKIIKKSIEVREKIYNLAALLKDAPMGTPTSNYLQFIHCVIPLEKQIQEQKELSVMLAEIQKKNIEKFQQSSYVGNN